MTDKNRENTRVQLDNTDLEKANGGAFSGRPDPNKVPEIVIVTSGDASPTADDIISELRS